jgi:hypothetical protein
MNNTLFKAALILYTFEIKTFVREFLPVLIFYRSQGLSTAHSFYPTVHQQG